MSARFSIRSFGFFALPTTLLFAACGESNDAGNLPPETGGSGGTVGVGGTSSTGGTGITTGGSGGAIVNPNPPPPLTALGVKTWRGDARAAYTIVHDDTCVEMVDNQIDVAAPELAERGLRATFGAIVQGCAERDGLWEHLEALREDGHEIANHTWDHPNLPELVESDSLATATEAIDRGETSLEQNLDDFTLAFFIFPYDAFTDPLLGHLATRGYLGARAGERGYNSADFSDPFRLNFDVFGPGYSIYAGAEGTPCAGYDAGTGWDATSSECRSFVLRDYVDEVIAAGGYGIRELHSVQDEAWEPVPLDEYETHLDYLVTKVDAGELWVDTAEAVVRYRMARDACPLPSFVDGSLVFGAASAECTKYATALTYELAPVSTPPTGLTATQGGIAMTVVARDDGTYLVDADPTRGSVMLSEP